MPKVCLSNKELLTLKNSMLAFVLNVAEMPTASQHRIAILPQMIDLLLRFRDIEFRDFDAEATS